MKKNPFRGMEPRELAVIHKLLEPTFPGRDQLLQQLESAEVRTIDGDGSLEFSVKSDTSANDIKHAVPTEAEYEDPDGVTVHVLLHVAGTKAKEVEFYREDGQQVQSWPTVTSMRVFAPE